MVDFDIVDVRRVLARRDFLTNGMPRCPACDSDQVQLTFMEPPAEWKCRRCKLVFNHEPNPQPAEDAAR